MAFLIVQHIFYYVEWESVNLWTSEPMNFGTWSFEPLNLWTFELLNLWTLEPLNIGKLENWSLRTLEPWNFGTYHVNRLLVLFPQKRFWSVKKVCHLSIFDILPSCPVLVCVYLILDLTNAYYIQFLLLSSTLNYNMAKTRVLNCLLCWYSWHYWIYQYIYIETK